MTAVPLGDSLAICGGHPVVPEHLRTVSHPIFAPQQFDAVQDQMATAISLYDDSGVYRHLEGQWGDQVGRQLNLSVNSGTSALISSYFGLDLERGAEVLISSYNFFAAATPLFVLGLVPVLVDCGRDGNIDSSHLSSLVGPRTAAISLTHMWGYPCDMPEIARIASKAGIPVVEDASHAHGASLMDRPLGSWGAVGAWSLQGKKLIAAGEGGMLSTDTPEIFERAVLLGHFNKRAMGSVRSPMLRPYADTGLGLNLRMHPLGAALALTQLPALSQQVAQRTEVAEIFRRELSEIDGLAVTSALPGARPSYYALAIRFDSGRFPGVSRELFVRALNAEGATEVDIPGATRPLYEYEAFRSASRVVPGARDAIIPHRAELAGTAEYSRTVLKMPTFYGPERFAQADAYISAFHRVSNARASLATLRDPAL